MTAPQSIETPTPWKVLSWNGSFTTCNKFSDGFVVRGKIIGADGHEIASSGAFGLVSGKTVKQAVANAAFIVKAVNSHDGLKTLLAQFAAEDSQCNIASFTSLKTQARNLLKTV